MTPTARVRSAHRTGASTGMGAGTSGLTASRHNTGSRHGRHGTRSTRSATARPGPRPRWLRRLDRVLPPARLLLLYLLMCLALPALPALAQDRAEVAPSQIIGNRELPKVIYIVPWKKPAPDPLTGRPAASVLDEVLAPVDRDVFRRRLAYSAGPETAQARPQVAAPAKP